MKKDNKGFSLVELIVVVLIMGILAVALTPQVLKWVNNSRIANDFQLSAQIQSAAQVALTDETAYSWAKKGAEKKFVCTHADGLKNSSATFNTTKPASRTESTPSVDGNGNLWFEYKFLEAMGESDSKNIKTQTSDVTIELTISTAGKVNAVVKKNGTVISTTDQ